MRLLLESYGFEVRDHASARAFLSHAEKDIGCLLVDHHMPEMTGLDLLESLRARNDKTPVLIITGRGDPAIAERAARLDVELVNKPVGEDQLVEWVDQALKVTAGRD